MMIDVDPKIKKKRGAEYFQLPEELDDEWIKEHQKFLVEEQETKIKKKFEKENEKLKEEGQKEMKQKELDERLKAAKELQQKFNKENKTKKVEAEGKGPTVDKLEANLDKLDQRIKTMNVQAADKENNKEVSLGTSKIVCFFQRSRNAPYANNAVRITSILVLQLYSQRSSTFQSKSSFPRLYARNSTGLSNRWMRIGSFEDKSIQMTSQLGGGLHHRRRIFAYDKGG